MEQRTIVIWSLVVAVVLGGTLFYFFAVSPEEEPASDIGQANVSVEMPEEDAVENAVVAEVVEDVAQVAGASDLVVDGDERAEEGEEVVEREKEALDVMPTAETGSSYLVTLAALMAIGLGLGGMVYLVRE